jgi:hypothetical protein
MLARALISLHADSPESGLAPVSIVRWAWSNVGHSARLKDSLRRIAHTADLLRDHSINQRQRLDPTNIIISVSISKRVSQSNRAENCTLSGPRVRAQYSKSGTLGRTSRLINSGCRPKHHHDLQASGRDTLSHLIQLALKAENGVAKSCHATIVADGSCNAIACSLSVAVVQKQAPHTNAFTSKTPQIISSAKMMLQRLSPVRACLHMNARIGQAPTSASAAIRSLE